MREISRFVTQGRNFGLSYIALTQRLASVDSNLVEISGLKYFGKIEGDNNRRKAKAWLPKEYLNQIKDLKTGEFLQQYGSKITLDKVQLFQSRVRPKPYVEPQKPKKPNLIQRIIRAVNKSVKRMPKSDKKENFRLSNLDGERKHVSIREHNH